MEIKERRKGFFCQQSFEISASLFKIISCSNLLAVDNFLISKKGGKIHQASRQEMTSYHQFTLMHPTTYYLQMDKQTHKQ